MEPIQHVSIERCVAFLVETQPLTTPEHTHLLQCSECRRQMMKAGRAELRRREEPAA
jgi:hypothetical protein